MWQHERDLKILKQQLESENEKLNEDLNSKTQTMQTLAQDKRHCYDSNAAHEPNKVWETYRDAEQIEQQLNCAIKDLNNKIEHNVKTCNNFDQRMNKARTLGNVSMFASASILLGWGFRNLLSKK